MDKEFYGKCELSGEDNHLIIANYISYSACETAKTSYVLGRHSCETVKYNPNACKYSTEGTCPLINSLPARL